MKKMKCTGFGEEGERDCLFDWPEDCYVQGGESGVVFSKKGNYRTAFFEAYPKGPKIYVRGEGETIQKAEESAWAKYQKIITCPEHNYERIGEGCRGTCKHCSFENDDVFEPLTTCEICQVPTREKKSKVGKWYCEEHKNLIPEHERYNWEQYTDPLELFKALMEA